ncbi:MAG: BatD family protein [Verrucomicrobia bacterium]|nr:BatD family protein [Verrucomicrobiota bacterium]
MRPLSLPSLFTRCVLLLGLLATLARAESVHWEGSPDDPSEVQLVFDDCAPDGDPRLPATPDVSLTLSGSSSQTSIINGSFSRSTILSYSVRSRRAGASIQIPAFSVQTNKGPKLVAAYTGGAARVISDSVASARLTPGSTTVWAGEVFPVTYVLDASRRSFSQLASAIDWNPSPLVVEDWSKPEPTETVSGGEPRLLVTYRARAYAKASGTLTLNPTTQLVNVATGSIGFGLFQQQRIEQLSVSSRRTEITVNPLPTPPPGFTGAVGQFQLVSKVVPTSAAVGEPVTWTLELKGTGNWPDIAGLPSREVSKDFQVVQPEAKRTTAEGKLFDATLSEDVVLVPTKPGIYPIKPVNFVYFDPKSGEYKTLTTASTTLTITAAPAAGAAPRLQVSLSEPPATPPAASSTAPAPEVVPAAPADAIPRDPLAPGGPSPRPLDDAGLILRVVVPLVVLLGFWLGLALQRAFRTDPQRGRREARVRLGATIARLRVARDAERATLLLAWQHDSALLWELALAAPPAASVADEAWRRLWEEADRTLYRSDTDLPADWTARAEAALVAKRVPGFSPLSAFRPRNLLPLVAVLAVGLLLPRLRADDAAASYRKGDFAAAEKSWADEVAKDPTNASARYNLSLALAQQDRWDLALAHATAALVQDPSDAHIRWQFALAGEKAGFVPAPLAAFPRPGPLQSLAQLASPGGWQRWMIAGAWAVAGALGLLLLSAYRRLPTAGAVAAALLFTAGLVLVAAALLSLHTYGPTADQRAVMVWRGSVLRSIPTEADTTQKTTTLAAGSVAIVDRTFLGWQRLEFENGQTGWVRSDDTLALWR